MDAASPIDVVTLLTRGEEDEGVVFPCRFTLRWKVARA